MWAAEDDREGPSGPDTAPDESDAPIAPDFYTSAQTEEAISTFQVARRHRRSGERISLPDARTAAGLLPQHELTDAHRAVGRLAHVIDSEGSDGARGHRLHLHAGPIHRFDLGLHLDEVVADGEIHMDRTDQEGMTHRHQSAVLLAAWIPATRAAARTSPLVMALLATFAVVSGFIATLQRARARRWVASLGETSTIRVPLNGSRWLRLRSVMGWSVGHGPQSTGDQEHQDGIGTLSGRLPIEAAQTERIARLPTYEYRCDSCDQNFDAVQSFHDDPLTACPTCGSPVRKVFGNVGIVFKGSGFYKTDSRTATPAKGEGAATPPRRTPEASDRMALRSPERNTNPPRRQGAATDARAGRKTRPPSST